MPHHPSVGLAAEWIAQIRKEVPAAEQAGQLTPVQLDMIYRQRWFHLFVPEALGGLNFPLPEAVRLEESIAWADGSMGWVVTLCAGAGLFVGYLEETLAHEIFINPRVCLAGSGQVNGIARTTPGGFEVSGSWNYSSGAPHATHFTANCNIGHAGGSYIRSFVFRREEVTLSPNWKYMGLNATGGHAFSVEKLTVPYNRSFHIDASHARWPAAVYRYPFLQLAQSTIAVNLSGMCLYFLELAAPIITRKGLNATQVLENALEQIQLLREGFYVALDRSWESHLSGHAIPENQLDDVSEYSVQLAHQCRNVVDRVYPYCGLTAARIDTAINQVWRNIHTASQHSLLNGF